MGRVRTFAEQEVVDGVSTAFWDKGYAATSLDDIVKASGLGKGSLYAAFGDKYGLFRRVFDTYCVTVTQGVRDALAGPDEAALQRLESLIRDAAERREGSLPQRACFLAKTTAELAARDEAVAERSRLAFNDLAAALSSCIVQAQAAGDIDPAHNATKLGHHALAVLRGMEAIAESGADATLLRDAAAVTIELLKSRPSA